VVILVGPGASGKSTWAAEHFPPDVIVSSDRLRALVGSGEDDVAASEDAFALLDQVVRQRVGRRLTTVIDTLGLDGDRRRAWRDLARQHDVPCVVVAFDTPPAECRARNRQRAKQIPATVLSAQLQTWSRARDVLGSEGYDHVLAPEPVRVVPKQFVQPAADHGAKRAGPASTGLRFGLHLSSYAFTGGRESMAQRIREIGSAAEQAGFDAIYVMDHFRQIPQVGRAWDDMLESYTTLGYLAACTEKVRIGTLVTGITYRNVAHLAKIVSTLDVLSGGRSVCGLGLAWFAEEHRAYGWDFPGVPERYMVLEDALQLLPVMWGPGSKPFEGKVVKVPDTSCYPRPLQERVPIVVGGGGEQRTLRLAAQYADMANVFGDVATVRRKADVLARHCVDIGREAGDVRLSHLSTVLIGSDDAHVRRLVDRLRPRRQDPARFAAAVNAGTVTDHVGRFSRLAEAGAAEVVVRLADLEDAEPIARMGSVIERCGVR
jgi:F420-dependent oxidoreductase-like protein